MNIPTLEEVQEYFKNAKEITCLMMGINVSIAYVTKFQYHEDKKSYTVIGGVVTVWNDKSGFATITKTKCASGNCKDCKKCKEAKK